MTTTEPDGVSVVPAGTPVVAAVGNDARDGAAADDEPGDDPAEEPGDDPGDEDDDRPGDPSAGAGLELVGPPGAAPSRPSYEAATAVPASATATTATVTTTRRRGGAVGEGIAAPCRRVGGGAAADATRHGDVRSVQAFMSRWEKQALHSRRVQTPVRISVIIPALDAAATIAEQLAALAAQTVDEPFEVLVVDNGSRDATTEVARGFADRLDLRVLACATPGTSAARNAGVRGARGDKLLFCDADDAAAPGWVAALAAGLDAAPAVGGAIENELLSAGSPFVRRHPPGLPVAAGFLPRAITANFAVRRAVWEELGGFDEAYDYGAPDTEFCWRLQLAGHRLAYEPGAVMHYRHRGTLRSTARKAYRTGIARARLFRDYHAAGMPRPRTLGALARAGRLVARAPGALVSPRIRWWWLEEAAGAWGRLVGSARYRVRYL